MSEPLLVGHNNGVKAVMTESQHRWMTEDRISDEEMAQRQNESSIVTFAPRRRIRDWYLQRDPRFLGVSGSLEDLDAILKRHRWQERWAYVPFSNGSRSAKHELLHHAASWETFRAVFAPNDWTFKFGKLPEWLVEGQYLSPAFMFDADKLTAESMADWP